MATISRPRTPSSATSSIFGSTTPPPPLGHPPALTRMHTGTAHLHHNGKEPFDVVAAYRKLLASDPDLTMPVAAIEALVSLLAATPNLSTISETLDLLATASATLKRAAANPISLSAGTDLFTRYIVTTLRTPSSSDPTAPNDFHTIRNHLLSNGRLFVSRAKEGRRAIAKLASRFVREGKTILTNGGSRVVGATLMEAAEAQTRDGGAPRFKVIYITGKSATGRSSGGVSEGADTITALRKLHVPVAEISEAAVAYSMGKVDVAFVGAEGVVENGGVISRMGTYQLGLLAKAMNKPVYVVAESHKFVRLFPLGQYDIGVDQKVLDFRTSESKENESEKTPIASEGPDYFTKVEQMQKNDTPEGVPEAVDYTPPELITALITEAGIRTPSAVSEELIKIWY